jgi:hypothetical protein
MLEVVASPSEARLASLRIVEKLRKHFTRSLSIEAKFGAKLEEQRVLADGDAWFHQSFEGIGAAERAVFRFGRLSALIYNSSPSMSISIPLHFERANSRNAFLVRDKERDQIQIAGRIDGNGFERKYSKHDIDFVANSGIWPIIASVSAKDFLLTPLIDSNETNGLRVAYVFDHAQNLGTRKKLSKQELAFVSARINELAARESKSVQQMTRVKRAWLVAHLRNWLVNRKVKFDRFPSESNFDVTVTKNKLLDAAYRLVINDNFTHENIFSAWSIRAVEDRVHDFTLVIPSHVSLPVEGNRFPARDRIRVIRYNESDSGVDFVA